MNTYNVNSKKRIYIKQPGVVVEVWEGGSCLCDSLANHIFQKYRLTFGEKYIQPYFL